MADVFIAGDRVQYVGQHHSRRGKNNRGRVAAQQGNLYRINYNDGSTGLASAANLRFTDAQMYADEEARLDTQNERGLGLKFDAGKPQARLVFEGFPLTFLALADVLTMGARKYSAHSWQHVENGIDRYSDAAARHMLARLSGETHDPESGLIHEAHELINRMFVLELKLRQEKDRGAE